MPGDIPVIQSDRGGQVTYHGPGQQVMYVLLNLKRRKLGVRELVTLLEQTVVNTLAEIGIDAHPRADAPGVYVGEKKICSLGLRIRKGCSFHGLAHVVANGTKQQLFYILPACQAAFWPVSMIYCVSLIQK